MAVRPPPLVAGSHIRILSPSGPVTEELVRPGVDVLRDWDLRVTIDERAFHRDRYLAGTDDRRAAALNDAIGDPDVDAVIFSRGGYGAMRILDAINWRALADKPKLLCGFSDVTALHLAALHHANIATLHGPVLKSFGLQNIDLGRLKQALFGSAESSAFDVEVVRPSDDSGDVTGPAIGGNLSLVAAMLASSHMPRLDGAILFLEDVGEDDYRLDRLFTALRLSPALSGIAAVVLGDFLDCGGVYLEQREIPKFVRGLGRELGDALDIPILAGFPMGHGARNVPLLHGVDATIDLARGQVTLAGAPDE